MTQARPTYGPHAGGVRPPSLHQKLKWIAQFVQKLFIGSHSLEIGHVTPPSSLRGRFIISTQRGPFSMSVPNFKRTALFVQKLLGGSQNSEIGSRDPGHADLGVISWSTRCRCPSSISLPNLKRIALFVQTLFEVPKISKLGHVTHAMPIYGSFYGPHVGWVRPPSLYQKLKWIAQFVQKLSRSFMVLKFGN